MVYFFKESAMELETNEMDNNFAKTFKPVIFLQTAIGCARVNLCNNSVSRRLWYQKIYGCVNLTLCSVCIIYLTGRSAFYEIDERWSLQTVLGYAQVVSTLFLNSCPFVINSFVYSDSNLKLMTALHEIDQSLKITKNENNYKRIYMMNWVFMAVATFFHGVLYIIIVTANLGYSDLYYALPALLILLAQDLEVAYFIMLNVFLILRVRYINALLNRSVDMEWKSLRRLESSKVINKKFHAYRLILDAYSLIEKTFSHFIVLLVVHMFTNELLALKRFISQGKNMSVLTLLQTIMVVTKVFNRVVFIGAVAGRLERQFEVTKVNCLLFINDNTDDAESRRQAKNIFRLVSQVARMRVFCMFRVSSLPLQLVALTATYAVVLLQLTFSSNDQSNTFNVTESIQP